MSNDDWYEEEADWIIEGLIGDVLVSFGQQAADELVSFIDDDLALWVLAQLGDRRAFEPLLRMAQAAPRNPHSDSVKLRTAIHILGELGDPRAVAFLLNYVTDQELGGSALSALGHFDDQQGISALTEQLYRPASSRITYVAAQALDQIGTEQTLAILTEFCREKSRPHRDDALDALSHSQHSEFASLFEQILHDARDSAGWLYAIEFFWDKGRFPALEQLRAQVPRKPAAAIDAFIQKMTARSQIIESWQRRKT